MKKIKIVSIILIMLTISFSKHITINAMNTPGFEKQLQQKDQKQEEKDQKQEEKNMPAAKIEEKTILSNEAMAEKQTKTRLIECIESVKKQKNGFEKCIKSIEQEKEKEKKKKNNKKGKKNNNKKEEESSTISEYQKKLDNLKKGVEKSNQIIALFEEKLKNIKETEEYKQCLEEKVEKSKQYSLINPETPMDIQEKEKKKSNAPMPSLKNYDDDNINNLCKNILNDYTIKVGKYEIENKCMDINKKNMKDIKTSSAYLYSECIKDDEEDNILKDEIEDFKNFYDKFKNNPERNTEKKEDEKESENKINRINDPDDKKRIDAENEAIIYINDKIKEYETLKKELNKMNSTKNKETANNNETDAINEDYKIVNNNKVYISKCIPFDVECTQDILCFLKEDYKKLKLFFKDFLTYTDNIYKIIVSYKGNKKDNPILFDKDKTDFIKGINKMDEAIYQYITMGDYNLNMEDSSISNEDNDSKVTFTDIVNNLETGTAFCTSDTYLDYKKNIMNELKIIESTIPKFNNMLKSIYNKNEDNIISLDPDTKCYFAALTKPESIENFSIKFRQYWNDIIEIFSKTLFKEINLLNLIRKKQESYKKQQKDNLSVFNSIDQELKYYKTCDYKLKFYNIIFSYMMVILDKPIKFVRACIKNKKYPADQKFYYEKILMQHLYLNHVLTQSKNICKNNELLNKCIEIDQLQKSSTIGKQAIINHLSYHDKRNIVFSDLIEKTCNEIEKILTTTTPTTKTYKEQEVIFNSILDITYLKNLYNEGTAEASILNDINQKFEAAEKKEYKQYIDNTKHFIDQINRLQKLIPKIKGHIANLEGRNENDYNEYQEIMYDKMP